MIRVRCCRQAAQWELHLSGHAGTAPYGQDLVCAAVTALVCALAKYLSEHGQSPTIRLNPGDAKITAKGEAFAPAFETVLAGLRLLSEEYPESVDMRCEISRI